jgi:hypothetical protein
MVMQNDRVRCGQCKVRQHPIDFLECCCLTLLEEMVLCAWRLPVAIAGRFFGWEMASAGGFASH